MIDYNNITLRSEIIGSGNDRTVLVKLEEKPEDIKLMIKYQKEYYSGSSHFRGDVLYVETIDGHKFEYGLYSAEENSVLTKTKLYRKTDVGCVLSNNLFWAFTDRFGGYGGTLRKEYSKFSAEFALEQYIRELEKAWSSDITYNKDAEKTSVLEYLELNDIATEENIKKVNAAHFSSKIDGIDGIAGKKIGYDLQNVDYDSVDFIVLNGKELVLDQLETYYRTDESDYDGYDCYRVIPLDQFEDNGRERLLDEVKAKIEELVKQLKSIKPESMSLSELHEIQESLSDVYLN